MAVAPPPSATADQISYTDLYARWERGNWSALDLDLTVDRRHWHGTFTPLQRKAALWNSTLFLHGEQAVAEDLSPFIDAAPREEHKWFLATQQVDEARHAVFFKRFVQEVVGIPGDREGSMAGVLEATEPELTWGFRRVFAKLTRSSTSCAAGRPARTSRGR